MSLLLLLLLLLRDVRRLLLVLLVGGGDPGRRAVVSDPYPCRCRWPSGVTVFLSFGVPFAEALIRRAGGRGRVSGAVRRSGLGWGILLRLRVSGPLRGVGMRVGARACDLGGATQWRGAAERVGGEKG